MAKYMLLFTSTVPASEQMAKASPEEMKASMDEWVEWHNEAAKTATLEWGLPLQAVSRITTNGVTDSDNHASGYSMIEGEKEVVLALVKKHPHLKWPGASIDLLELLSMPGLKNK